MKRKTAQRNGSAILWAVLVMLMISLISAGIILVDRMYFMREQEETIVSRRSSMRNLPSNWCSRISAKREPH